jgi:excisionase family DNA binding protein
VKTRQKLGTWPKPGPGSRTSAAAPRRTSDRLAHLFVMETSTQHTDPFEQVVSITDLAGRLHVSVQTIYDLRSRGRGPRGFRVGREIRFRISEVEAWLARMEDDDERRHPAREAQR